MVFYVQGKLLFSLDIVTPAYGHFLSVPEPYHAVAHIGYHIEVDYKILQTVLESAVQIPFYLTSWIIYGYHFLSRVYLRFSVVAENINYFRDRKYFAAPSVHYRNAVAHLCSPPLTSCFKSCRIYILIPQGQKSIDSKFRQNKAQNTLPRL